MTLVLFRSHPGAGGGGTVTTKGGKPIGLLLALTHAQKTTASGSTGKGGKSIGLLLALTYAKPGGIIPPPPPTDTSGGGGVIVGGTFSRGQWHNLKSELRAKALKARRKKEQEALERAAQATAQAVEEAELSDAENRVQAELAQMGRALRAANGAVTVADTIKQANLATAMAHAILRQLEEEDEDDALVLLLQ